MGWVWGQFAVCVVVGGFYHLAIYLTPQTLLMVLL
jgi:hypothetical protein